MRRSVFFFLFLYLLCLLACKQEQQAATEISYNEFEHKGLTREYIYFAPPALKKDAPLIVVMHGFTSSAENIRNYSGMNALAKKYHFAVVYPQGTIDKKGNSFWNVGYAFHADSKVDDVDFIVQLVKSLQQEQALSTTNTFVTGMSNGGEMCYLLSCQHPEVFKAAAPVAGTMMNGFFDNCNPDSAIPIFAIFGTTDKTTNYLGDEENKDGWGAYKSIPSIVDFWTNNMQYDQLETDTLPDLVKTDSSFVISQKYLNTSTRNEFLYYKIIGGGHDWPGAWGNEDINSSEVIWKFFKKYME